MKKILIISTILIGFLTQSCSKFLNTEPEDFIAPETYYKTESDLNTALTGVYDILGASGLYRRNLSFELSITTDEGFNRASTGVLPCFYNHDAADPIVLACWTSCYQGIERANLLLANIDKADASQASKEVIRGQALFLRAYYYFILVTNWGDVPLKLAPAGSLSEIATKKSPAAEIYNQIVADMTTAEGLVKDITEYNFGGRISKSAVRGMLAKVCLHAAGRLNDPSKYELSLQWSDKLIKSNLHSLNPDYKQIFINYLEDKYDVKESIWEAEFSGNNVGTSVNEAENYVSAFGVNNADLNPVGFMQGLVLSTAKFYDAFSSSDLRRDWIISTYTYVSNRGTTTSAYPSNNKWRYIAKYRRDYQTLTPKAQYLGSTNFPLLRYADVLLMYAEASNEVNGGPNQEALESINKVRRRAVGTEVNTPNVSVDVPAGTSKADFLTLVRNERFKELAFEGIRKMDLMRWGIFLQVMADEVTDVNQNGVTSGAAWPGKVIVASRFSAASERHLLLPIPQSELSLNKDFGGQNPNW